VTARRPKPRLDHVDAMRPVKQAGVVSTHTLLFFAPGAAISVGGALMLLHVTREAFLFISACMLTYAYSDLHRVGYRYFYRRRFMSVAVPYACWTLVYFAVSLPGSGLGPWSGLEHLGFLLATGYYQLYYLVVIMQFYVLFPVLFWLVRRSAHRPWAVVSIALCVQVLVTSLMHWNVLPPGMRGFSATREVTSYLFYLVAGMVVALHLDDVHRWLLRNGWRIFGATLVAAAVAEAWFVAAHDHFAPWLGNATDPLQPIVIPFNIGAIACVYLFGVWLVDKGRPRWIRAVAASGSDNSYSVYLAQMLFVYALGDLGWRSLDGVLPWPVVAALGVAIVFLSCVLLSSVLARTPLAAALTGRKRASWSTWLPERWRGPDEVPREGPVSPVVAPVSAATTSTTTATAASWMESVPATASGG
jgi:peptidoglycan/LPS O-acetylase OafA/YrhL